MLIKLNEKNFKDVVREIVGRLQLGKLVIAPFDTVYGLICDPRNEEALQKLFKHKQRDISQTIGLAASSYEQLHELCTLSKKAQETILELSPGEYTFILKSRKNIPVSHLCQKNGTVGIRVPDSKLILEVINQFGFPIAQTSANISGKSYCTSAEQVQAQLGNHPDILIVDGGTIREGQPSTIFNLTGDCPIEIERE